MCCCEKFFLGLFFFSQKKSILDYHLLKTKKHIMKSKRLHYYKLTKNDFNYYHEMAMDINVMQMITGYIPSLDETKKWFAAHIAINRKNDEFGFFGIRKIEGDEFIGYCKIVKTADDTAEIGYALNFAFWNNGFATEISAKLVEYAMSIKSLNILIALIDPENYASEKILRNSRFELVQTGIIGGLPSKKFRLELNRR